MCLEKFRKKISSLLNPEKFLFKPNPFMDFYLFTLRVESRKLLFYRLRDRRRLGWMLRQQMGFKRVLVACDVRAEFARLFRRHAALVLKMAKEISPVVVGLEAPWTLVILAPLLGAAVWKRKRTWLV